MLYFILLYYIIYLYVCIPHISHLLSFLFLKGPPLFGESAFLGSCWITCLATVQFVEKVTVKAWPFPVRWVDGLERWLGIWTIHTNQIGLPQRLGSSTVESTMKHSRCISWTKTSRFGQVSQQLPTQPLQCQFEKNLWLINIYKNHVQRNLKDSFGQY